MEVIGAVHGGKDSTVSNQVDPCFEICEGIQHRCDGWRSREEHREHGVVIGFQLRAVRERTEALPMGRLKVSAKGSSAVVAGDLLED